jgi:hypothetical protein
MRNLNYDIIVSGSHSTIDFALSCKSMVRQITLNSYEGLREVFIWMNSHRAHRGHRGHYVFSVPSVADRLHTFENWYRALDFGSTPEALASGLAGRLILSIVEIFFDRGDEVIRSRVSLWTIYTDGRMMRKQAPAPTSDSILIRPLCSCTARKACARPMPLPLGLVV